MDVTAAGLFLLLSLLFCIVRSPAALLVTGGATAVAGATLVGQDRLVTLAGLLLYSFGLSAARVMLTRSVSLQLLRRIASGAPGEDLRESFAARLGDAEHHRLVARSGQVVALTPFGRLMAALTSLLYALTGSHR